MPREKKYTKTIAFRVTAEEAQMIDELMVERNVRTPSAWLRLELAPVFEVHQMVKQEEAKRAEAKAKRAAKKTAANVNA